MTPEARRALSDTVRGLRVSLVRHIHGAVDSQWLPTLSAEGLAPAARRARERFEEHVADRARGSRRSPDAVRADAEKLAAATWLNRLVFLRIFEAHAPPNRRSARVVTGYKSSPAYAEFVGNYAGPLGLGESFGYDVLLRVVFDELAVDLPGLFGPGIADLLPFPPVALNDLLERLNDPALESCWTDDTAPGWVYQYWNDPDREALDAKIADGGKIAPHEIASKTQMFTERYMVEWLLHNSLGPAWLGICRRNGWTAEVERDGVLVELDRRRAAWRGLRERGEVALDALMPLESDVERRWAYYVPQELPPVAADGPEQGVPDSIRGLRILDPACGSGHFLIIAFDLLVALYEEEARHRDAKWARKDIAAWILEDNLHGVDLDMRAVQIAAAALWSKARLVSADVAPKRMNLVAADLGLSRLPADDPARKRLVEQIKTDTGMPPALVDAVWKALAEVDFLGTLLKVDKSVRNAIEEADIDFFRPDARSRQGKLFGAAGAVVDEDARFGRVRITAETALARVQQRVEQFLGQHTGSDDLGLRLTGEQLAAGLRFLGMVQEGRYHLVVGNPPYQGTAKMADAKYVQTHYEMGKADLYAAFIVRALELCVPGGTSALLTMRNWMFIAQYEDLRKWILTKNHLCALGDVDRGAFEDVPDEVVSVVMSVVRNEPPIGQASTGMMPTPRDDRSRDGGRTHRKRAAVLAQVGRFDFLVSAFNAIPGQPLVYWWPTRLFGDYAAANKVGDLFQTRKGVVTGDDTRFTRMAHELDSTDGAWAPFVMGGKGLVWFEPHRTSICTGPA
jgi:hypothetical protein